MSAIANSMTRNMTILIALLGIFLTGFLLININGGQQTEVLFSSKTATILTTSSIPNPDIQAHVRGQKFMIIRHGETPGRIICFVRDKGNWKALPASSGFQHILLRVAVTESRDGGAPLIWGDDVFLFSPEGEIGKLDFTFAFPGPRNEWFAVYEISKSDLNISILNSLKLKCYISQKSTFSAASSTEMIW